MSEIQETSSEFPENPIKWEFTAKNLINIDNKMVLPTLSKMTFTKLNVEETGCFIETRNEAKVDYSLENDTLLGRYSSSNVPFMSEQLKKGSSYLTFI